VGLETRFTIVYDNEAKPGFKSGWGFSCLVGESVLFDTGPDSRALLYNMQRLDINLQEIDVVVLSHVHGDHTGGIDIVEQLGDVRVFIPRSFFNSMGRSLSRFDNVEMVEVTDMMNVREGITSTGEIGRIGEQSLVVRTPKGLVLVTGCSHPGLDTIMSIAQQTEVIYGVIGGFHGFDKLQKLRDLGMIVPCHCTRLKKRILTHYPERSKQCAAGCIFDT
jgi:7,8-dihydropterin-6-yl-methyl-4-(beta-D-ribofuranosyl)aminobenzene 5'-phosphate synthase